MKWNRLMLTATLLLAGPAAAWEPHYVVNNTPNTYIARTTVLEILQDSGFAPVGDLRATTMRHLFVRFAADASALCPNRQYRPQGRIDVAGAASLAYVWIGEIGEMTTRTALAQLIAVKAAGTEVEIVIEPQNCRAISLRVL